MVCLCTTVQILTVSMHLAWGLMALMAGSSQRVMVHCRIPPRTAGLRLRGWSRPVCKISYYAILRDSTRTVMREECHLDMRQRKGCQIPATEYTASNALTAKGSCTVFRSNVLYMLVGMGTSLSA